MLTDIIQAPGGAFWLAVENDRVIGTIGLIMRENSCAILKKFFVAAEEKVLNYICGCLALLRINR